MANHWMHVLNATDRWSAQPGDAIAWLNDLPNDSVDLLFTSPPYLDARTYGIGFDLGCPERWAFWMQCVIAAAAPKVKGLIAVVCEGKTDKFAYKPGPALLVANLYRTGFKLRKPPAYYRIGIPGSGGPDWLRNDYEPIVCVTRGKLPWSDNKACGRAPKYAPGGEMSYRNAEGRRKNERHRKTMTREREGMHNQEQAYQPPEIANPGNVQQQTYTADEVAKLLAAYIKGDVKRCKVGGGQMGHDASHDNEAPFPLELAEFYVRTFCPPGGVVADCFLGSGTALHAAIIHGRRGIGCDIRPGKGGVETAAARLADVELQLEKQACPTTTTGPAGAAS